MFLKLIATKSSHTRFNTPSAQSNEDQTQHGQSAERETHFIDSVLSGLFSVVSLKLYKKVSITTTPEIDFNRILLKRKVRLVLAEYICYASAADMSKYFY